MAAKKDGTITGLRAKVWANLGAYLSTASTGIPTILHGLMLSGAYTIQNIHEDVYGVFTNTTPVDAYRGAGRPEATFIVERLVDLVAAELKMDPADIRRKNFIPPFTDGHTVATGLIYDTGNYVGALDKALQMVDYPALRKKQAELRGQGRVHRHRPLHVRGDLRPRALAGGGRGGLRRRALGERDRALPPLGQGPRDGRHLAARPGRGDDLRPDRGERARRGRGRRRDRVHGDTAQTPMGWGTYGSRTTAGRLAARSWARSRRSRRRPRSSPPTCSRRRSRTSSTPTASSS